MSSSIVKTAEGIGGLRLGFGRSQRYIVGNNTDVLPTVLRFRRQWSTRGSRYCVYHMRRRQVWVACVHLRRATNGMRFHRGLRRGRGIPLFFVLKNITSGRFG